MDCGESIGDPKSEDGCRVAATVPGPSAAVCVLTAFLDALPTVSVVTRYARVSANLKYQVHYSQPVQIWGHNGELKDASVQPLR